MFNFVYVMEVFFEEDLVKDFRSLDLRRDDLLVLCFFGVLWDLEIDIFIYKVLLFD